MYFENLWSLCLSVPAVILAALMLRQAWTNYRISNAAYGDAQLISPSSKILSSRRYMVFCILLLGGLLFGALALARPKRLSETVQFPQGTLDVVCVSDVSRSMAAQDYLGHTSRDALAAGTRLDMVRQIIRDKMIPTLARNRIGIVSFAGEAFDQAYLGDDYKALTYVLEHSMRIGSARGEGANVEAGLAMALHYMDVDALDGRQRVIVLFSDGGFDEESPKFAEIKTELARKNVRVLLVGMGGRAPVAIPVAQLGERDQVLMNGKTLLVLDGQTQMTARDDESLRKMAKKLDAQYVQIDSFDDFRLDAEDFALVTQTRRDTEDLFRLPTTLAFMAILAGQLCMLAPALFSSRTPKQETR